MAIIGHGQLQHHFWGDYCATIVLRFASIAEEDNIKPGRLAL